MERRHVVLHASDDRLDGFRIGHAVEATRIRDRDHELVHEPVQGRIGRRLFRVLLLLPTPRRLVNRLVDLDRAAHWDRALDLLYAAPTLRAPRHVVRERGSERLVVVLDAVRKVRRLVDGRRVHALQILVRGGTQESLLVLVVAIRVQQEPVRPLLVRVRRQTVLGEQEADAESE